MKNHPELDLKFHSIYGNVEINIENLILDCYELDHNERPNRYRLKYIDKIIKNFNSKVSNRSIFCLNRSKMLKFDSSILLILGQELLKCLGMAGTRTLPIQASDNITNMLWISFCKNEIEQKLGNSIRTIVDSCLAKKTLNKTQHERYFVSGKMPNVTYSGRRMQSDWSNLCFQVTEKEIYNGILNAKNVENNVLCFIREIEDVKDYKDIDRPIAWRYIDVDSQNEIDHSAQDLLNDLKFNKVLKKVPDSNVFRFKVKN